MYYMEMMMNKCNHKIAAEYYYGYTHLLGEKEINYLLDASYTSDIELFKYCPICSMQINHNALVKHKYQYVGSE